MINNKYLQWINNKYSAYLILICALLLSSCTEKDEFTPNEVVGDAEAFFVMNSIPENTTSFDAQSDFVHFTDAFSSVYIPANSLVDADGSVVGGNVQVSFSDVKSVGEMILNQWTTDNDKGLYAVEAFFSLDFSQAGEAVYIASDKPLKVRIRDKNVLSSFGIYENESLVSFNSANMPWMSDPQEINATDWSFNWSGKDWINEGYEIDVARSGNYVIAGLLAPTVEQLGELCVDLPYELYNSSNSVVYASFQDEGSVTDLTYDSEKVLFCTPLYESLRGKTIQIVSISNRNDETFYFGTTHAVIGEESVLHIVPEPKTREEILDALSIL